VACLLEAAGEEELDEVARVDALRRGVEAHIELDGALVQVRRQGFAVGRVGDEPTPGKVVKSCVHEAQA